MAEDYSAVYVQSEVTKQHITHVNISNFISIFVTQEKLNIASQNMYDNQLGVIGKSFEKI